MNQNQRAKIIEDYDKTRSQTLQIFDLADEPALHDSPGFGFRPIIWHLAHIGTFEEYWLVQKLAGENFIDERFQRIFDPISTPRESSKNLPTKTEMLTYLQKVRGKVLKVIENFDFDQSDPLLRDGYVFNLVHQHELQHQETLAYLFHLLPLDKLRVSTFKSQIPETKGEISEANFKHSNSVEFGAGNFLIGTTANDFAYDNEMPAYETFLPAFKLDRFLTTNREFAEFIAEKGYERREFWSNEGWQFKEKENLRNPLYWQNHDGNWQIRLMLEEESLDALENHPVYGISFYEAEAYARFRGKRLPAEFEWEKAASWITEEKGKRRYAFGNIALNKDRCNFGFYYQSTTPVDQFAKSETPTGCFDLNGNLWEWTSSVFEPYPNFRAFPYEDYSQTWFDNDHKVLKGGSFATSREILRTSFRNFFRPQFRIAFAGVRCASDV